MRLLHTADWHLGHTLHDHDRGPEHDLFLAWLLDALEEHRVDALLITGDVFDASTPPAAAEERWFSFLAAARGRNRHLDIVVTGGNHDSAARLDAPSPVLRALDVHVVGGHGHRRDVERLLIPVTGADGGTALVLAMPYLRVADLPRVPEHEGVDRLVEGVHRVYRRASEAALERLEVGQALVITGHCYMSGAALTVHSERKILGGHQHGLPLEVFTRRAAYVALGHLHLPQAVLGRERVRYCGSPVPLTMGERGYENQVVLVDLDGERLAGVRSLPVPRAVPMVQVPDDGHAPLDQVLEALAALPEAEDLAREQHPYLAVGVLLERPWPGLRQEIEEAISTRAARLVRLTTAYTGTGRALGDVEGARGLADLDVEEVFRHRWSRSHQGQPPSEILEAFHQLVEAVHGEQP